MAEDWSAIAAEVAEAIRSVGPTDAGYPGAIRRSATTGQADPYDPSSGTEAVTYHDCTIIVAEFSTMERASSAIGVTDKRVIMAPDADVEPTSADRLVIGMTAAQAQASSPAAYEIVRVDPKNPAGTVLRYKLQVRF